MRRTALRLSTFGLMAAFAACLSLAGCGVKGDPLPPSAVAAAAPTT